MMIHILSYAELYEMAPRLARQRSRFLCNAARIRHERDRLPTVSIAPEIASLEDLTRILNGEQVEEVTDCDDIKGWLDEIDAEDFPTVSEPTESSTATAAAYGDLDIAEWNAQHADWLDEKRTQEDARY